MQGESGPAFIALTGSGTKSALPGRAARIHFYDPEFSDTAEPVHGILEFTRDRVRDVLPKADALIENLQLPDLDDRGVLAAVNARKASSFCVPRHEDFEIIRQVNGANIQ
ncbi:hypothetical protein HF263_33180 [Rhizobium leguminosarum]|nr:hypothetical protein [Rhizobium leguminosarum]MBY2926732.1 hypothetical protein [Rhizobium leguminosarum]MBY2937126.1 hypothetical protein [Rhizobium leguminosarum]MBY2966924.1 hypothetical protein [Rhizobium leguminosarum]MBY2975353.1 hypothetical protein [Rhizobium leguminosarum]